MKITINEKEVDKRLVYVNTGMNFGRFDFQGLQIDTYKIVLTSQELVFLIEKEYNLIRDEIQKDDETYHETSEFSGINYGSIHQLLKHKNIFSEITKTYLDKIIFSKLFQKAPNISYIINSTDFVTVENGIVEFTGRCYQKT